MQTELHIIMPSAKPWNIPKIAFNMLGGMPCKLAIRWHILFQGTDADPKGFHKINACIDYLPLNSWFWTPSDDSLHQQKILRRTGEIIAANPSAKAIVFSEARGPSEGNRILRASPDQMHAGMVDGSQCVWSREFVGSKRYEWDKHGQDADGLFAEDLFKQDPGAFFFCDEVLCQFNSLEWV